MITRRGLTLLEVIIALAIFVGSVAVVSKLVALGVRFAEHSQLQTRAVMLAESKMGEIVAGIVTLTGTSGDTFADDPAWQWQLATSDGPVDGLKWVSVSVFPSATGELATNREGVEFTLSRWLFDPAYAAELDAIAAEAAAAAAESTSDTSSGTTGGSDGTGGSG